MEHYLTLHPRFGIEQIWPQGENSRCFGPGGEAFISVVMEISPELMPIAGSVPVVDTLMAFASLKSTTLLPLELVNILQTDAIGLRGGSSESDSDLLAVLPGVTLNCLVRFWIGKQWSCTLALYRTAQYKASISDIMRSSC
jgi:hypothetical protein